jgi:hypothetical protein
MDFVWIQTTTHDRPLSTLQSSMRTLSDGSTGQERVRLFSNLDPWSDKSQFCSSKAPETSAASSRASSAVNMPAELLETTCDFGLAPTGAGCDLTLASYDPDAYVETQVQYLAIGAILVLVTGFLCRSAKRNKCSNLQQRSLLLCFYAALTFAARGSDPGSYKHILPRPIINLLSSTCTAALYSI